MAFLPFQSSFEHQEATWAFSRIHCSIDEHSPNVFSLCCVVSVRLESRELNRCRSNHNRTAPLFRTEKSIKHSVRKKLTIHEMSEKSDEVPATEHQSCEICKTTKGEMRLVKAKPTCAGCFGSRFVETYLRLILPFLTVLGLARVCGVRH